MPEQTALKPAPKGRQKQKPPIPWRPSKGRRDEFLARVEKSGLSANAYINLVIFNTPPPRKVRTIPVDPVDAQAVGKLMAHLGQLRSEFGKIGSNINQIAKAANLDKYMRNSHELALAELEAAIVDFTELRAVCMQALGKSI